MLSSSTGHLDTEQKLTSWGCLSGHWMPVEQMSIGIGDGGFRQAVTVVERLRTYQSSVFELAGHLKRWYQSLDLLGISGVPDESEMRSFVKQLFDRNEAYLRQEGEVGMTWFATPGMPTSITTSKRGIPGKDRIKSIPTFGLHLNRLDLGEVKQRTIVGQSLVITKVVQPSEQSWPRAIKTRCRLHYYLADQAAHAIAPDSLGVLLDRDGTVTETSVCNLAIVIDGQIISPPRDQVLQGITQLVLEKLAHQSDLTWSKRLISTAELQSAAEVLLMGTDTGLWFADSVNGHGIGAGKPGPIYQQLRQSFDQYVLQPRGLK